MLRGISRLFVGALFICYSVFAQSEIGTATLNGTVTDPSGAKVSGANVVVSDPSTGFTRQTKSTDSGLYSLTKLPIGNYSLSIDSAGFKTAKKSDVSLGVGAVATLDVILEVGTASETVEVTSELPVVETSRSQTSTNIQQEQVNELPVNGRNFLDFTTLSPGVVRDPTRGGDLSFGGQRGTSNSLLIDGSDSNNTFFGQSSGRSGSGRSPYTFSQDAVEEFQVNTNSYGAEIGRAGGGVVNVVTKSGSNQFHGGAFEFFRDRSLNANTWENNRRNQPRQNYHFNQFGGNISGPIVKNKLFFFFDYDGQRNTTPNVVFLQVAPPSDPASQRAFQTLQPFLQNYANSLNNDVYLGKVDWNISDRQRLSVRYNGNRFVGQNYENGGTASALEHTGNSNVTTDSISGIYNFALSPTMLLDARYSFTRDDEPGQANSTNPEAVIRQGGTTVLSIGRNNFSPRFTNARTNQEAVNLSVVRSQHTFKFGADIIQQRIDNFFPGSFSGSYTYNSYADFANNLPFTYTQAFPGANTDGATSRPNVDEYGFFAQDSWKLSRKLTLNYGIRYDFFNYAQPSVFNPNPGLAALGLNTSRINSDTNNVAPRFGFAFAPFENGKTVFRGGYGMFYGRTPSIFTGTAFTQNGIQVQTYTLRGAPFPVYPNVLAAPPAANRIPDIFVFTLDYVQPLTHQWSFNIEQQLGKDYALTLGYLGVKGQHLTRSRDINLSPATAVTAPVAGGGALTYYRHPTARPNPNFGRITLAESGANSAYHGAFIQLTKRFSHNFLVQTSYTWSHVIDDNPDSTAVVVGSDDPKIVQDTLNTAGDRGSGNADIRHRFIFSSVWNLNYVPNDAKAVWRYLLNGWEISTIATVQSGRPFSSTSNMDLNNDGNSRSDRTPGEGRNTIYGPNFLNDDVRLSKFIPLGTERVRIQLIGEAFNVTNRANFASFNLTRFNLANNVFTPATNYLTPNTTVAPRILQLAAKITF